MAAEPYLIAFACLLALGCERAEPVPAAGGAPAATSSSSSSDPLRTPEPTRLIELPVSAYVTSLGLDEEAAYLLTPEGAYRMVPGEPPRHLDLPLGFASVLTRAGFVYWADGKILRTPKSGGASKVLARVPRQPQALVADGDALAWVTRDEDGAHSIQALEGDGTRLLVTSSGELSALDLVGSALYFVERPTKNSWRMGVVETNGGPPHFGPERSGRRPALLTGTDAVYYYDVDTFQIRRTSLDLRTDATVLREIVCTPLHAASDVYCASVEGLFVVAPETQAVRILSYGRPGAITSVDADAHWLVWTVDLGPNRLAVDLLPVAALH